MANPACALLTLITLLLLPGHTAISIIIHNVWFLRFWKDKDSQCSLFLPRVGEQTQEEEADDENLGQGFSTFFEGSNTNYYYSEDEEEYDNVEEEAAHQIYNSNK